MQIAIIVAMSNNRVIGINNQLPWHLPADLKHFKQLTIGHPLIMGRKTYESIGKPLPQRQNIIVSKQADYVAPGCLLANSLEEAVALAAPATQCFIIGGASIYQQALSLADTMYVTLVDTEITGDTYFPTWDEKQWKEIAREQYQPDEKNRYGYVFLTYRRQ